VLALRRRVGVRRRAADDAAVIVGGAATHVDGAPHPRVAVAVADNARAATEARLDADRWMNEGGSFDAEAAAALRATAGRR
jgi:hypothetical protein